jgi:muramidase (phage lysozyme)
MTRAIPTVLAGALLTACVAGDYLGGEPGDDPSLGGKADSDYHYIVIGQQDTFLKRYLTDANGHPVQAADLELGTEKCTLYAGSYIEIESAPRPESGHVRINMRNMIPGCEFSLGYVYIDHIEDASFPLGRGSCYADISSRQCAFLSTIAYAEGTGEIYNYTFGFQTFSSYADHPRRLVCNNGYCSDAAGRYQFLSTTWDAVDSALGLPDFSPSSQDLGALYLIRNRGVYNLDAIDTYSEFSSAIYALNREWASLPGSPYGQPTHSMGSLWTEYRRQLGW